MSVYISVRAAEAVLAHQRAKQSFDLWVQQHPKPAFESEQGIHALELEAQKRRLESARELTIGIIENEVST